MKTSLGHRSGCLGISLGDGIDGLNISLGICFGFVRIPCRQYSVVCELGFGGVVCCLKVSFAFSGCLKIPYVGLLVGWGIRLAMLWLCQNFVIMFECLCVREWRCGGR